MARLVVLYGAGLLLLAVLMVSGRPPRSNLFLDELYDLRHVLLFGLSGLLVLEVTALLFRRYLRRRSVMYLVAAAAVVLLGLSHELLSGYLGQGPTDVVRGLRDILGALCFITLSAALDRPLRRDHGTLRGRPRWIMVWTSVLVLAVLFRSLGPIALAYAGRNGAFPVVVDLASPWQRRFLDLHGLELDVVDPPDGWHRPADEQVARVRFEAGRPAIVIVNEPYMDWFGETGIRFAVYSAAEAPFTLTFGVHDKRSDPPPEDRYDGRFEIEPGANEILVGFEALQAGPVNRELRLQRIRRITVSVDAGQEPVTVFLSPFRLE